jgi:hypothetical protein
LDTHPKKVVALAGEIAITDIARSTLVTTSAPRILAMGDRRVMGTEEISVRVRAVSLAGEAGNCRGLCN